MHDTLKGGLLEAAFRDGKVQLPGSRVQWQGQSCTKAQATQGKIDKQGCGNGWYELDCDADAKGSNSIC